MCKVNIAAWEVKTYSEPNDINSGGATLAFVGQNAAVIFGGTLYKCQSVSNLPVPADKCEIGEEKCIIDTTDVSRFDWILCSKCKKW